MKLSRALVALAMTSVIALAGCTAPERAPSATATAPAPKPTPTPAAEPEVKVVVTTLTLDVYEDDVLTESWAHADRDPAEIPGLTAVFGSEPEVRTETGPGEGSPSTTEFYAWGGVELSLITSEFGPRTIWVRVTAPSVGDVQVEALGGARVGDDIEALAASNPSYTYKAPTGEFKRVMVDQILADNDPTGTMTNGGNPSADFVAVDSPAPFTTVTQIYAPTLNYGM